MYIENVIVGSPIVSEESMFSTDADDWANNERQKTVHTDERFLPKILVDIGVVPSISEVRRNKPVLMCNLDTLDFIEVKWGKRKIWILVGN